MNAQHTPGPWKFGHMMDGENVWVGPDYDKTPVAYVDRDFTRGYDEWESNARLIAAAPELLDLLKRAEEELRLIRMKDTATLYDIGLRTELSVLISHIEGLS